MNHLTLRGTHREMGFQWGARLAERGLRLLDHVPFPLEAERRELLASLASTRTQIQQAYGGFNTVCDSDLIESYVFEIKALQSRYDYLLRRVKELEYAP